MAERPQHIDRSLVAMERTAETFDSTLLYGDVQIVRGYIARLERQVDHLAYSLEIAQGPSLWRRIRFALGVGR